MRHQLGPGSQLGPFANQQNAQAQMQQPMPGQGPSQAATPQMAPQGAQGQMMHGPPRTVPTPMQLHAGAAQNGLQLSPRPPAQFPNNQGQPDAASRMRTNFQAQQRLQAQLQQAQQQAQLQPPQAHQLQQNLQQTQHPLEDTQMKGFIEQAEFKETWEKFMQVNNMMPDMKMLQYEGKTISLWHLHYTVFQSGGESRVGFSSVPSVTQAITANPCHLGHSTR